MAPRDPDAGRAEKGGGQVSEGTGALFQTVGKSIGATGHVVLRTEVTGWRVEMTRPSIDHCGVSARGLPFGDGPRPPESDLGLLFEDRN
jgi:hypothetical protein